MFIVLIEVEVILNFCLFIYVCDEVGEEVLILLYLIFGRRIKIILDEFIEDEEEGECRYIRRFRYLSLGLELVEVWVFDWFMWVLLE